MAFSADLEACEVCKGDYRLSNRFESQAKDGFVGHNELLDSSAV